MLGVGRSATGPGGAVGSFAGRPTLAPGQKGPIGVDQTQMAQLPYNR